MSTNDSVFYSLFVTVQTEGLHVVSLFHCLFTCADNNITVHNEKRTRAEVFFFLFE